VLAILRWAENPRDAVAGLRVLQLLPGIGPATAPGVLAQLSGEAYSAGALARVSPPAAAAELWPGLCRVIARLRDTNSAWQGQIGLVRDWYQPLLDCLYDYPSARAGDLDQLEQIVFGYTSHERFLTRWRPKFLFPFSMRQPLVQTFPSDFRDIVIAWLVAG
jgi:DNA helicase II / ATP-dependent DNA helicase PcrA